MYTKFFVPNVIIIRDKNRKGVKMDIVIYKEENYPNYNSHHII